MNSLGQMDTLGTDCLVWTERIFSEGTDSWVTALIPWPERGNVLEDRKCEGRSQRSPRVWHKKVCGGFAKDPKKVPHKGETSGYLQLQKAFHSKEKTITSTSLRPLTCHSFIPPSLGGAISHKRARARKVKNKPCPTSLSLVCVPKASIKPKELLLTI